MYKYTEKEKIPSFFLQQASKYMLKCSKIVSIGRLYWMENKVKGTDNMAWFEFVDKEVDTVFYGRN